MRGFKMVVERFGQDGFSPKHISVYSHHLDTSLPPSAESPWCVRVVERPEFCSTLRRCPAGNRQGRQDMNRTCTDAQRLVTQLPLPRLRVQDAGLELYPPHTQTHTHTHGKRKLNRTTEVRSHDRRAVEGAEIPSSATRFYVRHRL